MNKIKPIKVNTLNRFSLERICIVIAFLLLSGTIGWAIRNGLAEISSDNFNSTHTCFLNSSIIPEQEYHNETYIECIINIKNPPVVAKVTEYGEFIGETHGEQTTNISCDKQYNQSVRTPKPIKECVEWEHTPCQCLDKSIECCKRTYTEEFARGESFHSIEVTITNISNLLVENTSCKKWKYNFEVKA